MSDVAAAKAAHRSRVLARRTATSAEDRRAAAARAREHLMEQPELGVARTVAAYVAIGTEPETAPLLDLLVRRGVTVLLPVLRPDGDLDWAEYVGADGLADGPHRLRQPPGAALGVGAIAGADVVVLPALAVDARGVRLGRGGGAYDRALPRAHGLTVALVYAGEIVPELPADEHDIAVAAAATPDRFVRFG